jgi:DNA replication protein DnaC
MIPDFNTEPMVSRAHVMALAANDGWLEKGGHILCFGPPGSGKSHLAAGLALVENGFRVLFIRTTDLVQRLQVARQALVLEAAIAKLDK